MARKRLGLLLIAALLAGCALNQHDVITPDYHWHLVEDRPNYQISTFYWFATKLCQVRVIVDTYGLTFVADPSYCPETLPLPPSSADRSIPDREKDR